MRKLTKKQKIIAIIAGATLGLGIPILIYYLSQQKPKCVSDTDCPSGYECINGQCKEISVNGNGEIVCPPESPKWVEGLQKCMYGYCTICEQWFETKTEYDYHMVVYHPSPITKMVTWTGSSSSVFIDANEIGENAPAYVSMLYLDVKFDTQPDSRPWWCVPAIGAPKKAQFWIYVDGELVYHTGSDACPSEWLFNPVTIMWNKVIQNGISVVSGYAKCSMECPDTKAVFKEIKVTAMRGLI